MKWHIPLISITLISPAFAAGEGVVQKPSLDFYIVPNATILEMERASANASAQAAMTAPFVYKPVKPYTKRVYRYAPTVSKPAPLPSAPCQPNKPEEKAAPQTPPTFLKVFQQ